MARLRIVRTLIIEGSDNWVRLTLERCAIQPGKPFTCPRGTITELERREEEPGRAGEAKNG